MLMQPLKHCLEFFNVFFKGLGEDDNVVKVNETISKVEIAHASLHQPLKGCRCVAKPERHAIALVEA